MRQSSLFKRYAPKGAIMFVAIAAVAGALLISSPPQYSCRSTVSVSGSSAMAAGVPTFASFLTKDTTEDYLAALESQSLRQRTADTLFLTCVPEPNWQPNPLFYQISRLFSIVFKTKAPLDFSELDYPKVSSLEMNFGRVGKAKFTVELDGAGKYSLLLKGKVVDTKPVGEVLKTDGLSVALTGFTSGKAQSWNLKLTDPGEITSEMRESMTVFRVGLRSNTIGVGFVGAHPQLAANVVNTMVGHFIQRDIENTQKTSHDSLTYINQQIGQIKGEIESLQARQEDVLSDRSNLLASAARQQTAQALLAQKETYGNLQLELSKVSALVSHLKSDEDYIGYYDSGILNRPLEVGIAEDILASESRLKTELLVKTENHPDVIRERVKLRGLRENLANLLEESKSQLSKDVASSRTKVGEYESLLDLSPAVEVELSKIATELTIRSQTLGTLYAQQQMANLQKISDTSPIRVLDTGVPQKRPVKPRIMMVALGSVLFSIFLTAAILMFMTAFDKSIFGESDLKAKFGAPVLATLGAGGKSAAPVETARLRNALRTIATAGDGPVAIVSATAKADASFDFIKKTAAESTAGLKILQAGRDGIERIYGEDFASSRAIVVTQCGVGQAVNVSKVLSELSRAGISLAGFVLLADGNRDGAGAERGKSVEAQAS